MGQKLIGIKCYNELQFLSVILSNTLYNRWSRFYKDVSASPTEKKIPSTEDPNRLFRSRCSNGEKIVSRMFLMGSCFQWPFRNQLNRVESRECSISQYEYSMERSRLKVYAACDNVLCNMSCLLQNSLAGILLYSQFRFSRTGYFIILFYEDIYLFPLKIVASTKVNQSICVWKRWFELCLIILVSVTVFEWSSYCSANVLNWLNTIHDIEWTDYIEINRKIMKNFSKSSKNM